MTYTGGASYLAGNRSRTDARTVARIYGEYQLTEAVTLHARIENLFDEKYEAFSDAFGPGSEIEGQGRAIFVGATFTW